ncbi:MAG: hypothetical protein JXR83_22345 [Deltaproteobacteria bacterium]|nr:hypothetical protein [Deltaproteobacteria bacterium]
MRPAICLTLAARLFLPAASALAQSAASEPAIKVHEGKPAILVFKSRVTGKASAGVDATTLTNLASTLLTDSGRYRVISQEDVATMLDAEQQKQMVGCDDVSCLADIGNALGTRFLLSTQVGEAGGVTVVSATLIDAGLARVESRESVTLEDRRQIVDGMRVAVVRVLGGQAELAPPPDDGVDLMMVAWPALGLGALAGVVGIGGTGAALYFRDQALNAGDQSSYDGYRGGGHVANTVSLVGYAAGGALLLAGSAAALVTLLSSSGPPDDEATGAGVQEVSP